MTKSLNLFYKLVSDVAETVTVISLLMNDKVNHHILPGITFHASVYYLPLPAHDHGIYDVLTNQDVNY